MGRALSHPIPTFTVLLLGCGVRESRTPHREKMRKFASAPVNAAPESL